MYFSLFLSFCPLLIFFLAPKSISGSVTYLSSLRCQPNINCFNGECIKDTCVCSPGWAGDKCNICNGRITLTEPSGLIIDGHGNYSVNTRCTWLLRFKDETSNSTEKYPIKLTINKFITECGWDHLYAFDGPVLHSPLRAVLSGSVSAQTEITLHSGYGFLYFFSDSAVTLEGFNISYRYIFCPNDCSTHGLCNTSHRCICDTHWSGVDCSIPSITCNNTCNDRGVCEEGVCVCEAQFTGDDCSTLISPSSLTWSLFDTINPPAGRASAAVVYYNDSLYVYGGETMTQRHLLASNSSDHMYRLNMLSNEWSSLSPPHSSTTNWLFATLSHHQPSNTLYLSCGERDGVVTDIVQSYNIETDSWGKIKTAPIPVKGHSAHVIDDKLMLLFGYNARGFYSGLQIYNINSSTWSAVTKFSGVVVEGRYSHTSVHHESTNSIYVYGGYIVKYQPKTYEISQALYQLDLATNKWHKLLAGPSKVFLHSAAVWYDRMVIFGGDSHSKGTHLPCSSDVIYTYDFCCGEWSRIDVTNNSIDVLNRYGHHLFNTQHGDLYSYGGFNGVVLDELIKLNKPNCSLITDELICETQSYNQHLQFCTWSQGSGCSEKALSPLYSCRHTCSHTNESYKEQLCSNLTSCHDCNSTEGCNYLSGFKEFCVADHQMKARFKEADSCIDQSCSIHRSCNMCNYDINCAWSSLYGQCLNRSPEQVNTSSSDCPADCSSKTSCTDCTGDQCLWCASSSACVPSNTYILNYNYGQCLSWFNKPSQCQDSVCSSAKTCSTCQKNPKCGWCNDEDNTGRGECMEFSSLNSTNTCAQEQWYFDACPTCQCNGYSQCYNGTNECIQCTNHTTGDQCQTCTDLFHGDSRNEGICEPCDCEGVADTCDSTSGDCKCRVQGATGAKCDQCDSGKGYKYSSHLDQCYYNVGMDYRYTFNLSKPEDRYIEAVNIQSRPKYEDRDVEFTLTCHSTSRVTVQYYDNAAEAYIPLIIGRLCDQDHSLQETFSHSELNFDRDSVNSTFIVSLNNLTTPFVFKISFSQYSPINLFTFFLVFFGCFLLLLIVAGVFWKLRIRYNNHIRRQRAREERIHMANRPFASILLYDSELHKLPQPQIFPPDQQHSVAQHPTSEPKEGLFRSLSKRGKKRRFPLTQKNATPMTIEYLSSQRVAVYTTIIKLPNGENDRTPDGISGLAIASTLVANPLMNNLTRATYKNGKATIGTIA